MKVVFIFCLVFLGLLVLLLIPLPAKVQFVLDIKSHSLYYSLSAIKINLSKGKLYLLDDFTISQITTTSKIMKTNDPKIVQQLLIQKMFSYFKIRKVVFLLDGGLTSDAFLTSMLIGTFQSIILSLIPQISASKIDIQINPTYNENNLNIASKINITINALSIIISIIYAKTKYSKMQKGEVKWVEKIKIMI